MPGAAGVVQDEVEGSRRRAVLPDRGDSHRRWLVSHREEADVRAEPQVLLRAGENERTAGSHALGIRIDEELHAGGPGRTAVVVDAPADEKRRRGRVRRGAIRDAENALR